MKTGKEGGRIDKYSLVFPKVGSMEHWFSEIANIVTGGWRWEFLWSNKFGNSWAKQN